MHEGNELDSTAVASWQTEPRFRQFTRDLQQLLNGLLDGSADVPPPASQGDATLQALVQAIAELRQQQQAGFEGLAGKLEQWTEAVRDAPRGETVAEPSAATAAPDESQVEASQGEEVLVQVLADREMLQEPALAARWTQLAADVLRGKQAAGQFAGQILLFRSATRERIPPLLKDVGEAYYQWKRKSTEPSDELETALADWVNRVCAEADIPNTVELVRSGERYDHLRHNADRGGNEVADVLGWVVARRGSERPFAKARVSVR